MNDSVHIYEVGPRDGLQNEAGQVATDDKVELIDRLARAGLREIEATSFVSPEWIPQLADADALMARLPKRDGLRLSALVPNLRGYDRFVTHEGLDTAALFISASETHNRKNVNRGVEDHLKRLAPVADRCRADGIGIRAYVSTVMGCPYEGQVAVGAVVELARALMTMGADQVALGDTIGVGVPAQTRALVKAVSDVVPVERLVLHVHDTYGRGLANVWAAYESGVRNFDASVGGLGGCPYAPGAAGNVATEDVVDLFEAAEISTGVDLDSLVEASAWLESDVLKRPIESRVYKATIGARNRRGEA